MTLYLSMVVFLCVGEINPSARLPMRGRGASVGQKSRVYLDLRVDTGYDGNPHLFSRDETGENYAYLLHLQPNLQLFVPSRDYELRLTGGSRLLFYGGRVTERVGQSKWLSGTAGVELSSTEYEQSLKFQAFARVSHDARSYGQAWGARAGNVHLTWGGAATWQPQSARWLLDVDYRSLLRRYDRGDWDGWLRQLGVSADGAMGVRPKHLDHTVHRLGLHATLPTQRGIRLGGGVAGSSLVHWNASGLFPDSRAVRAWASISGPLTRSQRVRAYLHVGPSYSSNTVSGSPQWGGQSRFTNLLPYLDTQVVYAETGKDWLSLQLTLGEGSATLFTGYRKDQVRLDGKKSLFRAFALGGGISFARWTHKYAENPGDASPRTRLVALGLKGEYEVTRGLTLALALGLQLYSSDAPPGVGGIARSGFGYRRSQILLSALLTPFSLLPAVRAGINEAWKAVIAKSAVPSRVSDETSRSERKDAAETSAAERRPPVVKPPGLLAGFPVNVGGPSSTDALLALDLDNDGELEMVTIGGGSIVVISPDGKVREGFPVALSDAAAGEAIHARTGITACDLDGDGKAEIVAATSNQRLYAIDGQGKRVAGFPVELEGVPKAMVSCLARADSGHDLLLTTGAGDLLRVPRDGGKAVVLASIGEGAESGVAVSDLDADGSLDLIVGGGDGQIYAFDANGETLEGFPYRVSARMSGVPAVGDMDDDGRPEIVFISHAGEVGIVDAEGNMLKGFPVKVDGRSDAGVSLGDLSGDGVLDVVVGTDAGSVYAIDGSGTLLPGFPRRLPGRISTEAILVDLDGDVLPDAVAVTDAGDIYGIGRGGQILPAFPLRLARDVRGAPVAVDLDDDGRVEVGVQAKSGELYAFRVGGKAAPHTKAPIPWAMAAHDPGRTGRFAPNPGRFKELGYAQTKAFTQDELSVAYRFFDLDGDPEKGTQIRWYVDDKAVPQLNNARSVPASMTRKHQRWRYTLQEGDNFGTHGAVGPLALVFRSPPIKVQNSPPTAPAAVLSPERASTHSTLAAVVKSESQDADGDTVVYRYHWYKNSRSADISTKISEVSSAHTRKNQRWRVTVVPFDGEDEGPASTAWLTVQNSPPLSPTIAIVPPAPGVGDPIEVRVVQHAEDADDDVPTYAFRYWIDGTPYANPVASGTLPAGVIHKGGTLRVEVTAMDDEAAGGSSRAEVRIQNTVPDAPRVAIWPREPMTNSSLEMNIIGQSPDPDGDTIQWRHQWFLNGEPVDFPRTVPAEKTQRGQTWKLVVIPHDGVEAGSSGEAEVTIANTPPAAPRVSFGQRRYGTDVEIRPELWEAPVDADGDAVRLKYRWLRNGRVVSLSQPQPQDFLDPVHTAKGEHWEVQVTPTDGIDEGETASLAFSISNSPPGAPRVVLQPKEPTVRDPVRAVIARHAVDEDGDELTYGYRWFKDNVAMHSWPDDKDALLPSEIKHGERWVVQVRAHDGEAGGEAAWAAIEVANHAPDAPKVVVVPREATTVDDLVCEVKKEGTDPDGGAVTYLTRWFNGGALYPLSPGDKVLPASVTRAGQTWHCEVEAFDGALRSPAARAAAVVIRNHPPSAPAVAMRPVSPRTDDDLLCELPELSTDADADRVTYTFRWYRDGDLLRRSRRKKKRRRPAHARHFVASSATTRGERWACEVFASDGTVNGPTARAEVVIANTPPRGARVEIRPAAAHAGDRLRCEVVEPSSDADGDEVSYAYTWTRDGRKQTVAGDGLHLPGELVNAGDIWSCSATPSDGTDDGPVAISQDILVRERPPLGRGESGGSAPTGAAQGSEE